MLALARDMSIGNLESERCFTTCRPVPSVVVGLVLDVYIVGGVDNCSSRVLIGFACPRMRGGQYVS